MLPATPPFSVFLLFCVSTATTVTMALSAPHHRRNFLPSRPVPSKLLPNSNNAKHPMDVQDLIGPFERGENTDYIAGHGLGLSIVATIAALHNGALSFENSTTGLQARLSIQRA